MTKLTSHTQKTSTEQHRDMAFAILEFIKTKYDHPSAYDTLISLAFCTKIIETVSGEKVITGELSLSKDK